MKEKISSIQLAFLVINFTIGSALIFLPSSIVNHSKQDGWISAILSSLIGAVFAFIIVSLIKRFPNKNFMEILEFLLGKWFGRLIGLFYSWFFIHLAALVLRNGVEFVKINFMPNTPMAVFSLAFGIIILYTSLSGIEVISRVNDIILPISLIGIWLTIILMLPIIEPDKISPILANGIKPILRGTYPALGFPFAELVIFTMIIPFVNKQKNITKIFVGSQLFAGITLFFIVLITIMVLNIYPTEISLFAPFNVARLISIGDFLSRLEILISMSFIISIGTKLTISFYAGTLAIAQVFQLMDYRSIIIPLVIITVSFSFLLEEDIAEVISFASTTWTPYSFLIGVLIPLLLLGISFIKNDKS